MSRTRRHVINAQFQVFYERWVKERGKYMVPGSGRYYVKQWHWDEYRHAQRVAGLPTDWRYGDYCSHQPLRTRHHRKVRHWVRIVCRTRQWDHLHGKDAVLKDYLY